VSLFDLPVPELVEYRPEVAEPPGFDTFWVQTLDQARAAAWSPRVEPVAHPLRTVEVVDLRFAGFGGHEVSAWLMRPAGVSDPLPTVVEFNGYGGGRGLPHEHLPWVSAGYAYAFMDTRGQGALWGSGGDTSDPVGHGQSVPGFVTRGLERPEDHYFRRLYTDAVRLVETVRELPGTDPDQVAVTGTSQGGGIAIAVAGLTPGLVAAMPEVPFGCHWRWAVEHSDEDPYAEVRRYLAVHRDRVDQAFTTLGYFDGVAFARRAQAPALFSVGLMDTVCPPSTVYAAHNAWAGPHAIEVYPFNGHEGGQGPHFLAQAQFLAELVGR
jgi:cephalosporin-C deacetylase